MKAMAQSSVYDQFNSPFTEILSSKSSFECGVCTSEKYGDLASLGKRYSTYSLIAGGAGVTEYSEQFKWSKVILTPGVLNELQITFHEWITSCFVNFRGGVRFKSFWDATKSTGAPVNLYVGLHDYPVAVSENGPNPRFTTQSTSNHFVEFETPYNTYVPFLYRGDDSDVLGLNNRVVLPVVDTIDYVVGTNAIAFGDDFAMGVYEAPPLVTVTYTPLVAPPQKQLPPEGVTLRR
jgi:hypothetical protein